jgi:hypothetical protein
MLETAAPALQGPLNRGCESLNQRAVRSVACTLALSSSSGSGGLGALSLNPGQGSGFSVVATGFSNGSVYAHALELGQVLPAWLDAAPQCAYDKKGEVAAVRYEVEAVPAAPAAAGEACYTSGVADKPCFVLQLGSICQCRRCIPSFYLTLISRCPCSSWASRGSPRGHATEQCVILRLLLVPLQV